MRQRVRRSQAGHGIARALWTGLATAGVLMVPGAHAVGLGEIRPQSALNEALVAEIPLLDVKGLAPADLRVRLADPAEFARIGVEPDALLAEFRFELDLAAAEPRVRIRSNRPVTEPYLNFLVALEWPQGRLLKEFTLLLDPAAYDDSLAANALPIQPPSIQSASIQPDSEPSASRISLPDDSTSAGSQQTGRRAALEAGAAARVTRVQSGSSTLWRIASEHRPSRSVSVQQTMLAIQRLNPEAFIDGNINLLKADQTLQLPDEAEAAAVPPSEAVEQVARQSDQWRTPPPARSDRPAPIDATRPTAADGPERVAAADGRLEIVAGQADTSVGQTPPATSSPTAVEPSDPESVAGNISATPDADAALADDSSKKVAGGVAQGGGGDVLTTPVTAALEETDRLSREVVELRAQLEAQQALARAQLEKRDRQLALLDQRVAALQAEVDRLRSAEAGSGAADRSAGSTAWTGGAVVVSAGLATLVALLTALLWRSRSRGGSAEQRRSVEDGDPLEPKFGPANAASGALATAAPARASDLGKLTAQAADDTAAIAAASDPQVADAERTLAGVLGGAVAGPTPKATIVTGDIAERGTSTSPAAELKTTSLPNRVEEAHALDGIARAPTAGAEAVLPAGKIPAAQPEAPAAVIPTLATLSPAAVSATASGPASGPASEVAASAAQAEAAQAEAEPADSLAVSISRPENPSETPSKLPPAPQTAPANEGAKRMSESWTAEPLTSVDGGELASQVERELGAEATASEVIAERPPLAIADDSDASEDEIDLIAEADIYVAYGRHARAVSLLEVALLEHPERHDLRLKLLEVLAQGSDIDAFQKVANTFLALCSEPNLRAEALDLQARVTGTRSDEARFDDADLSVAAADAPSDRDVDFSIDWPTQTAPASYTETEPEAALPLESLPLESLPLESLPLESLPLESLPHASLHPEPPQPEAPAEATPKRSEFDALELALLELELDGPAGRQAPVSPGSPRDEFDFLDEADSAETKLDLARAYREMGDIEGAREILGEVLADGSASQRQAAREILATLG